MTASLRLPILAMTMAVAGCFDVPSDPAAPVLIDDFDGSDGLPRDRHFDQWSCGRYNQPGPKDDCFCDHDPSTHRSPPYAMRLRATIVATKDQSAPGDQLYTQATVAEDLSRMSEIGFSLRYEDGSPALPSTALLWVELHCSSAGGRIQKSVDHWRSTDWQTFSFPLSGMKLAWKAADAGLTACLRQVDSIHFSVNGGLSGTDTGSFVLYVDDVYLR